MNDISAVIVKKIIQISKMAYPTSTVLDEQQLLLDLFSETPAECLEVFQKAQLGISDLLTVNESDFIAKLSTCHLPFEVGKIWDWITSWRKRNVSYSYFII